MKRERSGGGSKMGIAYLLLCVLVVSVQSLSVDIGKYVGETKSSGTPTFYHPHEHLDLEYREHPELDPCLNKECPKGEVCHVVRNPVMLQVPIALCEKEVPEDKSASGDGCATFVIGSNVFQCKAEFEWAGIAKKQCQIRLAAVAETVFESVRYPCRFGRQSSRVPVFQQVEVSCCKLSSGTPTPTVATTEETTTSQTLTGETTTGQTTTGETVTGQTVTAETTTGTEEAKKETTPQPADTATIPEWSGWEYYHDDFDDFIGSGTTETTPISSEVTPPIKHSETKPPTKVSESTPPPEHSENIPHSKHPLGAVTEDMPTEDPPRHHHHLLWLIFPSVAVVAICSMACVTFCLVRTCLARRRLRRAHKRFPADPAQCILANEAYSDTEEEIYSKANRGMGGYEPAVKPVLIFRNDSSGDMLAYDMFIAGNQ